MKNNDNKQKQIEIRTLRVEAAKEKLESNNAQASSLSPSIFISLPPELIIAKPKRHNLCEHSGAPQYRKHLQKPNTVHDP